MRYTVSRGYSFRTGLCALVLLAFSAMGCVATARAAGGMHEEMSLKGGRAAPSFTMLASASLTEAMTELTRRYAEKNNCAITVIYGAPDELAESIAAGDPADMVVMEQRGLMRKLQQQGLLDAGSQVAIASNRLVFVASAGHRLARLYPRPIPLSDLLRHYAEPELVIADPEMESAGVATKAALSKLGYWNKLTPALVRAGSDRSALYLIAKGDRTGVVYASDAFHNPEISVLAEFPVGEDIPPMTYEASIVVGESMSRARGFLDFLKSEEAQAVLANHGFGKAG